MTPTWWRLSCLVVRLEVEVPPSKAWWCPGSLSRLVYSFEIEVPPAKAWWCPGSCRVLFLALKLKYHRLKPGGVQQFVAVCFNFKIEAPPAKPGGVLHYFFAD
jgi:hypothetical protein